MMRGVFILCGLLPGPAWAHATDQAFVLLLPTDIYITAGVAAVALTIAALFAVPDRAVRWLFSSRAHRWFNPGWLPVMTSLCSFAVLAALVALGFVGPRDPLSNLMPLMFWTIGWVGLVSLTGIIGDLWHWLNPWSGLYRLISPDWRQRSLPRALGLWPAVGLLMAFTALLLADIAPDDPARLARAVAIYWIITMAGLLIAGPSWLKQAELGHAISGSYAKLTAISTEGRGGPGWRVVPAQYPATGLFALTLLAAGSFDGLNETFWWLGLIGVNPLEFPGRSAVQMQTIGGLLAALLILLFVFSATVFLARLIGGGHATFWVQFERLALALLPIAFVYHVAHYLPSFLVGIQYTYAALSDPLRNGADLLGIGDFRVTTGFFNRLDTVRILWLTQAGLVVMGHVWSILLAHRIALDLFGKGRAARATLPLSLFMIGYTFLGLWLLAAPRGA